MSFIESMHTRYTTKMYDETKKIEENLINELKEILRMSPSSINSQPWKFTFVRDVKLKSELAKASFFNDKKVEKCDTLVVFSSINNFSLFEKQIAENLSAGAVGYYNQFIKTQPEATIKAWFDRQVYLALGVFLSACAEMNIDSTPMEGIDADKYMELLGDSDYTPLVAVSIGYRAEEDTNQPSKNPKTRKAIDQVIVSL